MNHHQISTKKRLIYIVGGAIGLFLVYFLQEYLDFYNPLFNLSAPERLSYTMSFKDIEVVPFVVNKAGRYILNDLFSIMIIYGLFGRKEYARFAFLVMCFGLIVLLPIYLFIYISQPDGFSSMLSHLHRVVMNPVLMMLLVPAFFAQQRSKSSGAQ